MLKLVYECPHPTTYPRSGSASERGIGVNVNSQVKEASKKFELPAEQLGCSTGIETKGVLVKTLEAANTAVVWILNY